MILPRQALLAALWVPSILTQAACESAEESEKPDFVLPVGFMDDCTQGEVENVKKALLAHPSWVAAFSEDGETCLHAAGIYGQAAVTKLVLEKGGDPDVRSSFARGLRMTPLSWNVFAGHVETARVLLEFGADPNLDFDSGREAGVKLTVLDVLDDILPAESDEAGDRPKELERFFEMKTLLGKYNAKRYQDLLRGARAEL